MHAHAPPALTFQKQHCLRSIQPYTHEQHYWYRQRPACGPCVCHSVLTLEPPGVVDPPESLAESRKVRGRGADLTPPSLDRSINKNKLAQPPVAPIACTQSFHSTPTESAMLRSGFCGKSPKSPPPESVLYSARSSRSSSRTETRSSSSSISFTWFRGSPTFEA